MPYATTVDVPRTPAPRFPDRCVVCGKPHPDNLALIQTRDDFKGRAIWAGWFQVRAPACRGCAWRILMGQVTSTLSVILIIGAGWGVYFSLDAFVSSWVAIPTALLTGIGGMVAYAVFSDRHPRAFEIAPGDQRVVYSFRDAQLGQEFAALNGTAPEKLEDVRKRIMKGSF